MGSTIKVSDEARKILEQLSEKTGKGISELATEAILSYYRAIDPDKEISSITQPRPISLRFKARCSVCGKELQQGSIAYYQKVTYTDKTSKSIVTCTDCIDTDETLIRRYAKKIELEKAIRALERKLRRYLDDYSITRKAEELEKLSEEVIKYLRDVKQYFVDNRELEIAKDVSTIMTRIDELTSKLSDVMKDIDVIVKMRVKQRSRYTYRS